MKYVAIILLFLLTACSTTSERIVYKTLDPEFPPVSKPLPLTLVPAVYDYPRDTTAELIIKNTTACLGVPEDKRNNSFWRRCGEFPRDVNSNIFLGFTKEYWNQNVLNWRMVKEQLKAYSDTIDRLNKQRQESIDNNKKEKESHE